MTLDEAMAELRKQLDGAEQHVRNIRATSTNVMPDGSGSHWLGFVLYDIANFCKEPSMKAAAEVCIEAMRQHVDAGGHFPIVASAVAHEQVAHTDHTAQALALAAQVAADDDEPSLLMGVRPGKQKVTFNGAPTRSFPDGAPDRAEWVTDIAYEHAVLRYAREWLRLYECIGCDPGGPTGHKFGCPTDILKRLETPAAAETGACIHGVIADDKVFCRACVLAQPPLNATYVLPEGVVLKGGKYTFAVKSVHDIVGGAVVELEVLDRKDK